MRRRPCMAAIFRSVISTSIPASWRNPGRERDLPDRRPRLARPFLGAALLAGDLLVPAVPRQFSERRRPYAAQDHRRGRQSRRVGVLLVDGQYEDIVDMDLATEWTEQKDPRRVEIGVRTANRKAVITGEIMTLAALRNRRKVDGRTLELRIAEGFTRFTWNGQRGYGMTEYIERIENGQLVGYPL